MSSKILKLELRKSSIRGGSDETLLYLTLHFCIIIYDFMQLIFGGWTPEKKKHVS